MHAAASDPETDAEADEPQAAPGALPAEQRWHRVALAVTALLIAAVVVTFPFAVRSMGDQLLGRQETTLYDMLSSAPITAEHAAADAVKESFVNISVIDIDPGAETVTLGIYGHRHCEPLCPTANATLFALDDTLLVRRGLPPSGTLTLEPGDSVFSETLVLPIRGQASLYPFDTWSLRLGLMVNDVLPNGAVIPVTAQMLRDRASMTLQNQSDDFLMSSPVSIDPQSVQAIGDPGTFLTVQDVTFQRPGYLKLLSVILVLLITISGVLALITRSIDDLTLGIGGLILGIWGVRSIMVPQPVPSVTAIDLTLSTIILLILLGLAIRALRHFHRKSGLAVRTSANASRRPE